MPQNSTDVALKRLQTVLEGPYSPLTGTSAYNNGSFSPAIATRRLGLLEGIMFEPDDVFDKPLEARGTFAGRYQSLLQMTKVKGKVPAEVYCDDLWFLFHAWISGTPTFVTLPNTPQVLLAATAIASTMPSLTTQPNATGDAGLAKLIAGTLSNASAQTTAVVVTITGTDNTGANQTDTLNFTAGTTTPSATGGGAGALTVTLWTTKYFATVTSITTSAQPSGDLLAFAGINGFLYTFASDMATSTLYSMTGEYWDGAVYWQLLGIVLDKMEFTAEIGKSFKVDADVWAKLRQQGTVSSNPIDATATAGMLGAMTNLPDNPLNAISTYAARFFADPIGTAAGTTQIASGTLLTSFKYGMNTKATLGKGASGKTTPDFVGRGYYGDSLTADLTLLGNGYSDSELTAYIAAAARIIRAAFPGPYLPCGQLNTTGNWPTALQDQSNKGGGYGIMFDVAGKYTKQTETKVEERIAYQFALDAQVDLAALGLNGFPTKIGMICRINPNQL